MRFADSQNIFELIYILDIQRQPAPGQLPVSLFTIIS